MSLDVEAQVAGRVIEVVKQVGDSAELEEVLLVLESMKMEIPVEAPAPGLITEVCVQAGQSVAQGDLLVRID
jgi:acetyl-CoA carboxylase biotin carboxyl carrier protein